MALERKTACLGVVGLRTDGMFRKDPGRRMLTLEQALKTSLTKRRAFAILPYGKELARESPRIREERFAHTIQDNASGPEGITPKNQIERDKRR